MSGTWKWVLRRAPDAWCLRSALAKTNPWREHSDNQGKPRAVLLAETIVTQLQGKFLVTIERCDSW